MTSTRPIFFSLRFKLTVGILLTVLVSMALLSFGLLTMIRSELLGQQLGRASLLARSLERVLRLEASGLLFREGSAREAPSLEQLLILFLDEEHLLGLGIFDGGGRVVARQGEPFTLPADGWDQGPTGLTYRVAPGGPPSLLVRIDLRGAGAPRRLGLLYSLDNINRVIAYSQIKAVLQVSVSALLLFVFLTVFLSVMVIAPLSILSRGIGRISEGDLEYRVDLVARDELGFLAESLNTMVATLKENRDTITAQLAALRKAHQVTLEAQARLIAAEKMASLGTLAAGVAHEVGNPLGAVIGYIHLLERGDLPPAERADCLRRAAGDLNRIHQIMLELLNYARPPSEPAAPLEINDLLTGLVDNLRREEALEHLRVELVPGDDLPRPHGFPHKLEQVFSNLIRNAVWATAPAGSLVIATAAAPAGGEEGAPREATITFTDDGRGIPEADVERIFDPFFTTRLGQGGTGLGLSISRRIVEEMGGSISVTSRPGQTSFVIRLPV